MFGMFAAKTPTHNKTPGKGGGGKTPNKSGSNTPYQNGADRFIPNRAAMDMESGYYALMNNGENINPQDAALSPASAEQQRRRAIALRQANPTAESKILAFKQKAPKAEEGVLCCVVCTRVYVFLYRRYHTTLVYTWRVESKWSCLLLR